MLRLFLLNLTYLCKIENKWPPMSRCTMKEYSHYIYPRTTISFKGTDYYKRKCLLEKKLRMLFKFSPSLMLFLWF